MLLANEWRIEMTIRAIIIGAVLVLFSGAAYALEDAEYTRKLAEYKRAWAEYETRAAPYWDAVAAKRQLRQQKIRTNQKITLEDYVLEQPPVYSGPPEPVDPSQMCKPSIIPVLKDFLRHAKDEFGFEPERASEMDFKRSYMRLAYEARGSGLTKSQLVRIYAFETGGGGYDGQAGLIHIGKNPCPRPISTALGYNQLLNANSIGVLAGNGSEFLEILKNRAFLFEGDEKAALLDKVKILRRLVDYCQSLSGSWSSHVAAAKTPKGMGVHAALLDIDIGPLMQVKKLVESLRYAKAAGITREMTGAELEMINFAGPGSGIDMIKMPEEMRRVVPTSNFYERAGYNRNGIVRRSPTVALLFDDMNRVMDRLSTAQGSKDLADVYPK